MKPEKPVTHTDNVDPWMYASVVRVILVSNTFAKNQNKAETIKAKNGRLSLRCAACVNAPDQLLPESALDLVTPCLASK